MKHGYVSQNGNNWIKGDWTVRFDKELIEVFNNPEKAAGKYYTGPIDKVDLDEILMEIDESLLQYQRYTNGPTYEA